MSVLSYIKRVIGGAVKELTVLGEGGEEFLSVIVPDEVAAVHDDVEQGVKNIAASLPVLFSAGWAAFVAAVVAIDTPVVAQAVADAKAELPAAITQAEAAVATPGVLPGTAS
jgi:hypothetical protein